mgnify:FL=1|tara:strand:- start:420 stop:686 length:267 start_codon:yes stop_codon:yes gene_type:complete
MGAIFQRIFKWMPLILFILLLFIDRDIFIHVFGYICLLIIYTVILVARILNARDEWHSDPKTSKISGDKNIQKMSDFLEKMDGLSEEE